ncbi:hypothetical protein D3C85_1708500 [compost metagenome]
MDGGVISTTAGFGVGRAVAAQPDSRMAVAPTKRLRRVSVPPDLSPVMAGGVWFGSSLSDIHRLKGLLRWPQRNALP